VYRYTAQRLVQALFVVLTVVTVVFVLARLSGNPALLLAPSEASKKDLVAISASLGLDQPPWVQYVTFLGKITRADFGTSYTFRAPVAELIGQALPYSFELGAAAFIFASVAGIALGTTAALNSGRWIDTAARYLALIGQSVPVFWLGMLMVLVFAAKLRVLPAFGSGGPEHLVLPAIALGLRPLAAVARLTRSATLEVMRAEHTLFERSKGVSQYVLLSHLFRNVSLPVITLSGVQLGDLLAGSVVTETLFGWPGLGRLAIQAVGLRDYAVIQAVVTVDTVIVVLLNLFVDLSYGWLDPRVRRRS
jgi:peptide/nickel transport system permease protein